MHPEHRHHFLSQSFLSFGTNSPLVRFSFFFLSCSHVLVWQSFTTESKMWTRIVTFLVCTVWSVVFPSPSWDANIYTLIPKIEEFWSSALGSALSPSRRLSQDQKGNRQEESTKSQTDKPWRTQMMLEYIFASFFSPPHLISFRFSICEPECSIYSM